MERPGPTRVLLVSLLLIVPMTMSLQSQQPPPTAIPGFYDALSKEAVGSRRGEAIFYQRCSLCHLPRIRKGGTTPGPAPSLTGVLKSGEQGREAKVREFILKGSERMPGWQYTLSPAQLDDVIAYLKTL